MSDHDKVMKVFDGLPLEYDSLVNPLLAQLPPPSFERTRAFLLAYEARLASRPRNTQGGQPQGSFSQTPQQPNQRRGQQLRYTNNASRFSSGILGIAPVQCQWCDEFGHTVCTCPSHSSSLAAGSRNQSLAVLQLDDSTWYPDTGASAHMTSNPGNLLSSSPYHGNEKVLEMALFCLFNLQDQIQVQEGEPRVNINPWFCRLLSYKENPIAEPSKFPSC